MSSETNLRRRKKLMTKKVAPGWYQRYMHVLPESQQVFLQPVKELKEEDQMLRTAKPVVREEDRTQELVKALENEKAMKIQMVLDLVAGDPQKMRDRVSLIKPNTNPIMYAQKKKKEEEEDAEFKCMDAAGNPVSFRQFLSILSPKRLPEKSKWRLLIYNKVIQRKLKDLIKQRFQQEIQQRWKIAIRRVRAVLRFFQIIANIARTTTEVFKKFRMMTESMSNVANDKMMFFNKHMFKASSYGRELDTEILFILGKPEHYRTWEEAHKAAIALRFIRSFSAFPQYYQDRLAMIAWHMEVPADKVIIREGHVADSFYFLITGKVVAVKLMGSPEFESKSKFNVLKVFEKDEMFGEEGISNRDHRQYSVTSIVKCTLLSVNIDDYYRIFNHCGSLDENPEHIRMISQMDFMKYFPIAQLIENSEGKIILFYYRRGSIITPHSAKSDYIYVVKSGTCRVLTLVRSSHINKRYKCVRVTLPPAKTTKKSNIEYTSSPLDKCKVFHDDSQESFISGASRDANVRQCHVTDQGKPQIKVVNASPTEADSLSFSSSYADTTTSDERDLIQDNFDFSASKYSLKHGTISEANFAWNSGLAMHTTLSAKRNFNYPNNRYANAMDVSVEDSKVFSTPIPVDLIETSSSNASLRLAHNTKLPSINARVNGLPDSSSRRMAGKSTARLTSWNRLESAIGKKEWPNGSTPRYSQNQPRSSANSFSSKLSKTKAGLDQPSRFQFPRKSLLPNLGVKTDHRKYMPDSTLNSSLSFPELSDSNSVMQEMAQYITKPKESLGPPRPCKPLRFGNQFQNAASVEKIIQSQNNEEDDVNYLWVCLKTLREADVFGIEDMELGDAKEPNEIKVALVSDGAEIILISKAFFMENSGPALFAYLRASSYIMPDRETILLDLQKREFWSKFQEKTVDAFYKGMRIHKKKKLVDMYKRSFKNH